MAKRLYSLIAALLIVGSVSYGQDPHFSQFYANPLYLNPALAGSAVCPRIILNFRDQWPAISGTFVTYSASFDMHIDKIAGGIGVLFMSDRAGEGTIVANSISAIYAYRLQVSRKFFMKAGAQATFTQKNLNWDKLTFGDQISDRFGFIYNTQEQRPSNSDLKKSYADFSAGLLGYGENWFVGFAAHHLTQPEEGFISLSKLPIKFTAHAGAKIVFKNWVTKKGKRRKKNIEDPSISPNILYMHQAKFNQLNYGFYFNKWPFVGGLWFRQSFDNADALIALVGIQQEYFKLGYSYDLTISKLTNVTGGSHEVSFSWQFPCPLKKKRAKIINCPSF